MEFFLSFDFIVILIFSALIVSVINFFSSLKKYIFISEKYFHKCSHKIPVCLKLEEKRAEAYFGFKFFVFMILVFSSLLLGKIYVVSGPYWFYYISSAIVGGIAIVFFANFISFFVLHLKNKNYPKESAYFERKMFFSFGLSAGLWLFMVFLMLMAFDHFVLY